MCLKTDFDAFTVVAYFFHVESVIGAVRQKYTMLESTIPIKLVMKREEKEHPASDKIVSVACALFNCLIRLAHTYCCRLNGFIAKHLFSWFFG